MSKIMKCFIICGVLVLTGFHSAPATAAYPERAINYIVAYRVGGGSDRTSRAFVPFLEKHSRTKGPRSPSSTSPARAATSGSTR